MPRSVRRLSPAARTIGTRRGVPVLAAVVLGAILAGCFPVAPVTPVAVVTHSQFEGFDVVSSIPPHPKGVAFLFHGHYGSANFAEKVETVDALNRLTALGYGYVSTDSTDRVNRQWDLGSLSMTANPDLARLERLHSQLVATHAIATTTPLLAIGMSNGGAFTGVFVTAFAAAGYPVQAAWISNAPVTAAVLGDGGLRVPTVFTVAANDSVVNTPRITAQQRDLAASGLRTELYTQTESPVTPIRFRRIPGIDPAEAQSIVDAYVATGAWDASGRRTAATVADAERLAATVALPVSVQGSARDIENQIAIALADHAFSATFADPAVAFLTRTPAA